LHLFLSLRAQKRIGVSRHFPQGTLLTNSRKCDPWPSDLPPPAFPTSDPESSLHRKDKTKIGWILIGDRSPGAHGSPFQDKENPAKNNKNLGHYREGCRG